MKPKDKAKLMSTNKQGFIKYLEKYVQYRLKEQAKEILCFIKSKKALYFDEDSNSAHLCDKKIEDYIKQKHQEEK